MKFFEWIKSRFSWRKIPAPPLVSSAKPLREFVYLDEVSLRSLLSSQTGEVTDTKSEQSSDAQQVQLDSTVSAHTPLLAKAELASRFQTTNSSTLQTSRKATVQSWFREFHGLKDLRLIEPAHEAPIVTNTRDLLAIDDISILAPAMVLERGALVEFRVRLSADPVFHIGTMMSEFTGMVDDSPELFVGNSALASIGEAQPINKILQRLLAGLIPIRAEAVDYVVVKIEDVEYVAHRTSVAGLGLSERRLEVVGVTEHLAYWKDIRRVLFAQAEFTMLCRVARSGLQESWTPVKLGDLFQVFAPDMVDKINAASLTPFLGGNTGTSVNTNGILLNDALRHYKQSLLVISGTQPSPEQEAKIEDAITHLVSRAATAEGQRSAFQTVRDLVASTSGLQLQPDQDSQLREQARMASGLPLFPSITNGMTTIIGGQTTIPSAISPRLIDVEVVAIYW